MLTSVHDSIVFMNCMTFNDDFSTHNTHTECINKESLIIGLAYRPTNNDETYATEHHISHLQEI